MIQYLSKWTSHTSLVAFHKIRYFCHIALFGLSSILLVATTVVLAYSMKMYYGSFLHAIPELITVALVNMIILFFAYLPSNEYMGVYGLKCMRTVLQEVLWSGCLSLGIFGGVTSLHQSTPGLMSTCGKYFICRGYICIFVSAWLCWLAITLPFVLLLSSAIYQKIRHQEGAQPVWKREVARFEYFWPGERAKKSFDRQRRSRISPRVLPSDLTTTTNEKFGTTPRGSMDPSHFPQSDNPSLPHEA